jgi:hypothetical protein
MKLGLLTAAFPILSLDEVAAWSADNGYEMLEIACWPRASDTTRRYAGVCHVDVDDFDPDSVREIVERRGLGISALAYYPNNLDQNPADRAGAHTHLRKVIDAAAARRVRRGQGVQIATENCPMIFSDDEWPGGTCDYRERILHVHAQDMSIDREGPYRHFALSLGMGWQVPRLPGRARWTGPVSSALCARLATTARSRSSTRIASSSRRRSSTSAASSSRGTRCVRCSSSPTSSDHPINSIAGAPSGCARLGA